MRRVVALLVIAATMVGLTPGPAWGTESGDSTFVARLTLGVLLMLAAGVVAWRKRSAEQE